MVAARREGQRRFHLADADNQLSRLAKPDCKPREIAVACHENKAVNVSRVQNVHRVDYHRKIRAVFARDVIHLLHRQNRVIKRGVMPAVSALFPVAVNSLIGQLTVF